MRTYPPAAYRFNLIGRDASSTWHIPNPWQGNRSSYIAFVESKSNLANKKHLAKVITGDETDWTLLGTKNEIVRSGRRINISPLLTKFEKILRDKVVAVAKGGKLNTKFINPSFNDDGTPAVSPRLYSIVVSETPQSQIVENYFKDPVCDFNLSVPKS
jgi:hypothetical protein